MSHPPCAESGDWSIRCTAAHRGHRRHSLPGTTEQPRAPGDIVRVDDGLPYFAEVIEGDGVSQGLRHRRGTGTGSISSELGTPARSRPATHLPWIHGAIGRADQQSPRQPRASERDHERPGSHGHPAADAQGDRAPRRRDRQDRRRRRDVPSGTRGAVGRCAGRSEGWKTLERGSLNPPTQEPFRAGAQKGSSAMPHKRNPIISERICGLARVLRGNAAAGLENVALWHERDISHSGAERVILPDSTILLDYVQHLAIGVVRGLVVDAERMRANLDLTHGALFSQRVLLALVESGLERDAAYRIAQEASQRAFTSGTPLRELLAVDPQTAALDLDA